MAWGGAFTLSSHSRYHFRVGSETCFRRLGSDVPLPRTLRVWKVGPTRDQHEDREVLFLLRADLPRPRHDVRPQRLQGEAAVARTLRTGGGLERALLAPGSERRGMAWAGPGLRSLPARSPRCSQTHSPSTGHLGCPRVRKSVEFMLKEASC